MTAKRDYETFSPERLQSAAARLFYTHGYAVGLGDILEAAGIYKATFYKYYDSKDTLAADYIVRKRDEMLALLGQLMSKRPRPAEFCASWVKLLAKSARSPDFYGCPFSNMFAQTLKESPALAAKLKDAVGQIVALLSNYFRQAQQAQLLDRKANAEHLALHVFTLYEGAMTMHNLTGDFSAFANLDTYLADLVAEG